MLETGWWMKWCGGSLVFVASALLFVGLRGNERVTGLTGVTLTRSLLLMIPPPPPLGLERILFVFFVLRNYSF